MTGARAITCHNGRIIPTVTIAACWLALLRVGTGAGGTGKTRRRSVRNAGMTPDGFALPPSWWMAVTGLLFFWGGTQNLTVETPNPIHLLQFHVLSVSQNNGLCQTPELFTCGERTRRQGDNHFFDVIFWAYKSITVWGSFTGKLACPFSQIDK